MPNNKHPKKIEVKKKPDIFKVYYRQRMGSDAQTSPLTHESYTNQCFSTESTALNWIINQTDHGKIYVIRNRDNIMINSYGWKKNSNSWGVINQSNYFGGYKIGNPTGCYYCTCIDINCHEPDHPCKHSTVSN